jgi:hypothetical protein
MISRSNSMTAFSSDNRPASVSSRSDDERVSVRKMFGKCSGVMTGEPFDQMNACSMMFSISRTFPGHG